MEYSELYDQTLKNSFAAIKKDINGIKARDSLIDEKLKNSFSNIKKDMGYLKKSIEELKAQKPAEMDNLNGRLGRIESAVDGIKNDFSKDIRKLEKDDKAKVTRKKFSKDLKRLKKTVYKNFGSSLDTIKSELKSLDEAGTRHGNDLREAIDSLKEELDVDSKLEKIEERISNDIKKSEKNSSKDFESDLGSIKSQLKALDEAAVSKGDFENAIDSLKEELDIDPKLKKIEERISKPVIKEVIKKEPVVIKEVIKEKPIVKEVIKEKPVKVSKRAEKEKKGAFSKMIDFFAED